MCHLWSKLEPPGTKALLYPHYCTATTLVPFPHHSCLYLTILSLLLHLPDSLLSAFKPFVLTPYFGQEIPDRCDLTHSSLTSIPPFSLPPPTAYKNTSGKKKMIGTTLQSSVGDIRSKSFAMLVREQFFQSSSSLVDPLGSESTV
jgi:hypothetical protein